MRDSYEGGSLKFMHLSETYGGGGGFRVLLVQGVLAGIVGEQVTFTLEFCGFFIR